jgi:hypothetical protein
MNSLPFDYMHSLIIGYIRSADHFILKFLHGTLSLFPAQNRTMLQEKRS